MWPNPQFPADLVTYTEEIFDGKLNFLWSFFHEEVAGLYQYSGCTIPETKQIKNKTKVIVIYRNVFRAWSNISYQAFEKVVNGFRTLIIFAKKTPF